MCVWSCCIFFFFKQKTAYEMRISDWSSDVCSSDLRDDLDPAVLEGAATGGIDILPGDHPGGNFPGGGHHPGGQAEPQPAIEYDPNRLFRRQAGQPAGQLRVILQCGIAAHHDGIAAAAQQMAALTRGGTRDPPAVTAVGADEAVEADRQQS